MRRTIRLIFIYLALTVVVIGAFEGLYRIVFPNKNYYSRSLPGQHENREDGWARPDPDLGWVFSGKNLNTFKSRHYRNVEWITRANREGFRADKDFRNLGPKSTAKRVMVLGDSFVFGTYIKYSETLPVLMQEELGPGYETFNLGIPGWGLDQMYLAYKKYVEIIDPDIVVLVFIDHDIDRIFESFRKSEKMNKPSFKLEDGKLVPRRDTKPDLADRLGQRSHILNDIYKKIIRRRRIKDISEAILLALSKEAGRRGQAFIIVRYPLQKALIEGDADDRFDLGDFSARHAIAYLDPMAAMRAEGEAEYRTYHLEKDLHPAMAGNRFMARYIAKEGLGKQ